MTDDRPFDIVLWGATGFAGRLTAEVLAERYPDLEWAIGGRSRKRLAMVQDDLGLKGVEIILGDATDRDSLDEIARSTRVVCTTVGPYDKYGSGLVAACAEHGTHYCDLTGEVPWVRRMIDEHHDRAVETGARITHFCGFDSIPSDLGTLLVQEAGAERFGRPCERVTNYVIKVRGGFSGGTIATLTNLVHEARKDPELRKLLFDPYALNPQGERSGPDGRDLLDTEWDDEIGAWVAPFLMAPVNTRVVRRTNALRDWEYGEDFSYSEVTRLGPKLRHKLTGKALVVGMGTLTGGLAFGPTRKVLQMVLPDPGQGPSEETIESGMFLCRVVGRSDGESLAVEVEGRRDPGYGATAAMLAASAVCLAKDDLEGSGGVLTPAAAMGRQLIDRLNDDGEVTLKVV